VINGLTGEQLYSFEASGESTVHDLFQHHMKQYFPQDPRDFVFVIGLETIDFPINNAALLSSQNHDIQVVFKPNGYLKDFTDHDHERDGKLEEYADLYEIKSWILNIVERNPSVFAKVSDALKNDHQVVMAVAQTSGIRYLKHAGEDYRKNREVLNAGEEALKAKYRERMVRLTIRPLLRNIVMELNDLYKEVRCSEATLINMI